MRIARANIAPILLVLVVCLLAPAGSARAVVVRDDPNGSNHLVTPPSDYDGVAYLSTVGGASSVLVDSWYLLTAKHAVESWSGHTAKFYLAGGTQVFSMAEVFTHPTADLAVIRLTRDTELTPYPLYDPNTSGSEVGKTGVLLGYGMSGTPATVEAGGDPNYPRGTLRVGYNRIDAIDPNYSNRGACLRMDFDSSTSGGGLTADKESMVALGDSGGPVFIDVSGQLYIAGIHVSVAAYDPNHWPNYGDLSYHVRTAAYASWIDSVIADVPAPLTGDFNNSGSTNAIDIDALFDHYGSADLWYDVSGDGIVGVADADTLIHDLIGTQYGDINLDYSVDAGDLSLMGGHWMAPSGAGWGDGDFNGDGKVDGGDLAILGGNWNWSLPVPPAGAMEAALPEPATLLLLALGGLALLKRKRKS